jgi:pimeloyl-ACP methyl ester carboxylesterase
MENVIEYNDGNQLAYFEFGNREGFPVLIQHGLIAAISETALFTRLIELNLRLISIARPGYGRSSPKVMNNIGEWGEITQVLVNHLKLSEFDIFGISSGAPYSYAIGYHFPDRARNIFILSGTPALYDERIQALWPFPINTQASLEELEKLAFDLFFANLADDDFTRNEIRDSMMNHCFGIAQDFKLRCLDWGFRLAQVSQSVYMRHSRTDESVPYLTAQKTADLLPKCIFESRQNDPHFSPAVLDDFMITFMQPNFTGS